MTESLLFKMYHCFLDLHLRKYKLTSTERHVSAYFRELFTLEFSVEEQSDINKDL